MKKRSSGIVLFCLLLATVSCKFSSVYEKANDIKDGDWSKTQTIVFDVPITDTVSGHDIYFTLRNTNDYPYVNLFLFVNTISPKGAMKKDTVEFTLADDKGKWLGKGVGDVFSTESGFKRNIRFPYSGTYRIEIIQAMRDDVLKGVLDIGVKVEKTK
jgi:gliding motility-associated lipoprotein GldH